MYHESTVVVDPAENVVRAYLTGPIPVITITESEYSNNTLRVQLPTGDPSAAATWLRRLAVAAEELAEQVDLAGNPGTVLADRHIAEAKAATGFGGAK